VARSKKADMQLVEYDDGQFCRRCEGLTTSGLNCCPGRFADDRDHKKADIAIIGEAPGQEEDRLEKFFVGPAGQVLNEWITHAGLGGRKIWLDNVVRCTLPGDLGDMNSSQANKLIRNCKPYLFRNLERLKPKVIVTVGNKALKAMTDLAGITRWRGRLLKYPALGAYIVPTFHPAAVLHAHRPLWEEQAVSDLILARKTLQAKKLTSRARRFVWVRTEKEFRACMDEMSKADEIALDFETTGLNFRTDKIIGLILCASHTKAYFIPFLPVISEVVSDESKGDVIYKWVDGDYVIKRQWLSAIKRVVENRRKLKILHNAGFDLLWFMTLGWDCYPIYDTMIVNSIIDHIDNGLKDLSYIYTDFAGYDDDIIQYTGRGNKKQYIKVPPPLLAKYGCLDGIATFIVKKEHTKVLQKNRALARLCAEHNELRYNLTTMEYYGIRTAKTHASKLKTQYLEETQAIVKRLRRKLKLPDLNPNASAQLIDAFWGPNGPLNIRDYRGVKKPSTDARILKVVKRQCKSKKALALISDLQDYRVMSKRVSTYLDKFLEVHEAGGDGRIRTHFTQDIARTGRLSSRAPALQNIPRFDAMRNCFIAAPGRSFVEHDYKQLEICIAAEESLDPTMLEIINTGGDYHSYVGSTTMTAPDGNRYPKQLFITDKEMRAAAKIISFSVIYGKTPQGLANDLNCSIDAAAHIIVQLTRAAFPVLGEWMDQQYAFLRDHGYVRTIFGRELPIANYDSADSFELEAAERRAINYPIQSGASDCVVIGINRVAQKLRRVKLPVDLRLTVHDSLLAEVDDDYVEEYAALAKKEMERRIPEIKRVKLSVDVAVGKAWGRMKEVNVN